MLNLICQFSGCLINDCATRIIPATRINLFKNSGLKIGFFMSELKIGYDIVFESLGIDYFAHPSEPVVGQFDIQVILKKYTLDFE